MSRWVLVDDTDPSISYTGQWFQDQGTLNGLGNFGPPYLSTLHGTDSDASFSYSFTGTTVIITGTNQFSNPSGVTNPSWKCSIDGVSVPSTAVSVPENRLLFCEKNGLSDGPHVITVDVTVSNQQTFWFDYIQYLPSPSVSLNQLSLSIDSDDSQIQYGTGWSPIFPGNMTGQTGSTFSFNFNGISLIWLGFYLNTLPTAPTTATYAIDGQSPVTFSLNGESSKSTGVQYNQVFFQTNQLSFGSHKIDVVYQGNSNTTPLTLSVLLVQNDASSSKPVSTGSLPQSANSPVRSSTTSPTSPTSIASSSFSGQTTSGFSTILSPHSTSIVIPAGSSSGASSVINGTSNASSNIKNHSSNLGSIVGGTIGGLGLLIFVILAIFFLRQRNNRSHEADVTVQPFLGPSTTAPSSPTQHPPSLDVSHPTNNALENTTSSLPPLTPNRPPHMMQVNNASPLSTHGLREQRKGEELINRTPRLQQETRAAHFSPPSIIGKNSQSTELVVRDQDAGIQLAQTDQHGNFVELLPPVYAF